MNGPRYEDRHAHAWALIEAARRAADPARAVEEHWPGDATPSTPVHLLAIGKASVAMALAAAGRAEFVSGVGVGVPEVLEAHGQALAERLASVRWYAADHPLATARNLAAAEATRDFVSRLGPDDRLIVLLSGGGSAQISLPLGRPTGGVGLEEIVSVSAALMKSGATIRELNSVRKHLESLKGGRLGVLCRARTQVLVLSDVLGDPLDVISSGPFAPDPTTFAEAARIARRVACPAGVLRVLDAGAAGKIEETPKPGDARLARIRHEIIANNAEVVGGVARAARGLGFEVVAERTLVEGEAGEVGAELGGLARRVRHAGDAPAARNGGWAAVWGGETTVRVGSARGVGGPSQELALAAAVEIAEQRALVVAFSTDGVDGPTDAAGAIVDGESVSRLRGAGVDVLRALADHDSHAAHEVSGGLIRTGATGTNLNHVAVLLVYE
jgi:glycerate-2-kinase